MILGLFTSSYPSASISTLADEVTSAENIFSLHIPIILSVSMVLFLILPILTNDMSRVFMNFREKSDFVGLTFIFFYLFIGFIDSENNTYLFQRLQIKLPFLILPFAAASINLSTRKFYTILQFFILITGIVALYTFINYLYFYDEINAAYLHAKVMPTPINHVRFSILAAIACYSSYYLVKNHFCTSKLIQYFITGMGAFLFLFIHLYSVRSGIISLYAIVVAEILIQIIKNKKYKAGGIGIISFLLMAVIIYNLSPSLKNKFENTKRDLLVYKHNGYANYNSLTTRLISYENAFEIFNKNKLMGCGLGNIENENRKLFKTKHPEIDIPIIPHNEFLYYLAGSGFIGLLIFVFCFFYPLFYKKNYRNEFLLMIYITLLLSFMTEPMIETQLGVACTLVFIILPLIVKDENITNSKGSNLL